MQSKVVNNKGQDNISKKVTVYQPILHSFKGQARMLKTLEPRH